VPQTIFFSYAHKDHKWLADIEEAIKPGLKNHAINIEAWSDKKMKPGTKWKEEIAQALERATVAVLLVTPAFLASDFVQRNELPPILRAVQTKGLTVVWIHVKAAMYRETEIADFQAAHDVSKPLYSMSVQRRSIAIIDICEKIVEAVLGESYDAKLMSTSSNPFLKSVNVSDTQN